MMGNNQTSQRIQYQGKTQKGLVLYQYGKPLVYQHFPIPEPKEGQFLVRVQASTVNPSDKLNIGGQYVPAPLPTLAGLEGTGRVVEANGANIQSWVGKRVSFTQVRSGAWGEYSISTPDRSFQIQEDVPLHSAASGIICPLTAIGMTEIYQSTSGKKGIIHTAAASSVGRMLNKLTQSLGIPLLNIVRKEEHAALLRSQGAKHVIITQGDWKKEYAEAIKLHGFNVLFDALGGGPITEALIVGLDSGSYAYLYGALEKQPLNISLGIRHILSKGVFISGYVVFNWYSKVGEDRKNWIRENYSKWLKTDLATHPLKTLKFSEIEKALVQSASKATEGKITLIPD